MLSFHVFVFGVCRHWFLNLINVVKHLLFLYICNIFLCHLDGTGRHEGLDFLKNCKIFGNVYHF